MKIKNLMIFGLLLSSFNSFSQSDSISRFPSSNKLMIEINFNPFGSDGIFSFDNLQTKYWINNKTALRLGIQFDLKNNSTSGDDYKSSEVYKPTVSEKSFLIGFKPGIEFRILEKSKISPYWGIEFSYINNSSKSEYVDYNSDYNYNTGNYVYNKVETNVDGAWREIESGYYNFNNGYYAYTNTSYQKERAYYSLGTNVLIGADYYFIKNMYLGFEIGLGYKMLKYKQIELEVKGNSVSLPSPHDNNKATYPSSKSVDFGFYYNNSIRLGIYF